MGKLGSEAAEQGVSRTHANGTRHSSSYLVRPQKGLWACGQVAALRSPALSFAALPGMARGWVHPLDFGRLNQCDCPFALGYYYSAGAGSQPLFNRKVPWRRTQLPPLEETWAWRVWLTPQTCAEPSQARAATTALTLGIFMLEASV